MENDMKKLLLNNIGLKIISILIAIVLWFAIVYTYDPAKTADFTIPVTVINGDSITKLGKVYEVEQGNTVNIRVKGKTSIVKSLRSSDFKATADISKLSPTYNANIDVVCTKSSNVEISFSGSVKMLQVKLEDLVTKQFPVVAKQRGTPSDGFFVGDSTTRPNLIRVSGGKSAIDKISVVNVSVDVNGANKSFFSEAEPVACDSDGNLVKSDSLSFSTNPISVTTKVYETKEVAVFVDTEGAPYTGYTLESTDYEPKSVIVAGDKSDLDAVSSLTVKVDVTDKITDIEETSSIKDVLPKNVFLTDPEASVSVKCKIARLDTREISLSEKDITINNQNENFDYDIPDKTTLSLKGLRKNISGVTISQLSPVVDVSGIVKAGSYKLPLVFSTIDGVSYDKLSEITVTVREKKKDIEDMPASESAVTSGGSIITKPDDTQKEPHENSSEDISEEEETSNIVK